MTTPDGALRGDEAELYERFARPLVRAVASHVQAPPAVIDDACANTWVIFLRRQPDRDRLWGWLKVVAIREACRLAIREGRDHPSRQSARRDPELQAEPVDLPRFESCVELHAELEHLAAELGPRKQRILVMHSLGFSYAEIASITGMTLRTVERQLLRARRRARELR